MTVYVTKAWGFDDPAFPLQFSREGDRTRALKILKKGDYVVIVGTMGREVENDYDKGRILGMLEPTKRTAMYDEFDLPVREEFDFVERNGVRQYKWPYTLVNKNAWLIEDDIKLKDICKNGVGMYAMKGIVPLTKVQGEKLLNLINPLPIESYMTSGDKARLKKRRTKGYDAINRGGSPSPMTKRTYAVNRKVAPYYYTYCMRLIGAKDIAFKIGRSENYQRREKEFNHYSMPLLGGIRYKPTNLVCRWNTEQEAHTMEQRVLCSFNNQRHPSNKEIIYGVSYEKIKRVWNQTIKAVKRGDPI